MNIDISKTIPDCCGTAAYQWSRLIPIALILAVTVSLLAFFIIKKRKKS